MFSAERRQRKPKHFMSFGGLSPEQLDEPLEENQLSAYNPYRKGLLTV